METARNPDAEAKAIADAAIARYWTDAEFHARVHRAVQVRQAAGPGSIAHRAWDQDSLYAGAATALHIADQYPDLL